MSEKNDKSQSRQVDASLFPACHGACGIVVRHIVPAVNVTG